MNRAEQVLMSKRLSACPTISPLQCLSSYFRLAATATTAMSVTHATMHSSAAGGPKPGVT